MLTSEMIKAKAKEYGADICGIAPIERFADVPLQRDPKQILPNATCVLGYFSKIFYHARKFGIIKRNIKLF